MVGAQTAALGAGGPLHKHPLGLGPEPLGLPVVMLPPPDPAWVRPPCSSQYFLPPG